jgi:hypothetical protein
LHFRAREIDGRHLADVDARHPDDRAVPQPLGAGKFGLELIALPGESPLPSDRKHDHHGEHES